MVYALSSCKGIFNFIYNPLAMLLFGVLILRTILFYSPIFFIIFQVKQVGDNSLLKVWKILNVTMMKSKRILVPPLTGSKNMLAQELMDW